MPRFFEGVAGLSLAVRVRTERLERRFGHLLAVAGVSFEVYEGEVFGLLGPNGAGKTTLVRMLSGVLAPTAGDASIDGVSVARRPELVKELIGYATQEASVYPFLTVRENLEFRTAMYLRGAAAGRAVADALSRFGLEEVAGRRAGVLSGGWRQRLSIAQAVVHGPRVAFLDEPTSGLDPLARRTVWELVYAEAERGMSAVVTTHYMDEAERCHRVGLIHRGRLVAVGEPRELKAAVAREYRFYALAGGDAAGWRGREGVVDAWRRGAALRIITRADAPAPPGAVREEPTMEDVFVLMTRKEEAGELE
ncbi:ABC transporter ATP-binding protein [Oceanithermus sp.]